MSMQVEGIYIECTSLRATISSTSCTRYRQEKRYPGCEVCAPGGKRVIDMNAKLREEPPVQGTGRRLPKVTSANWLEPKFD